MQSDKKQTNLCTVKSAYCDTTQSRDGVADMPEKTATSTL